MNFMINIAIVEDDINYQNTLKVFLERYKQERNEEYKIDIFSNALNFLDEKKFYNIIFLDIEMPFMNGIEAAKKIRETNKNSTIIFITNMAKYAVKGYEVDAMDFLIKPVEYFNLSLKLDKAIKIQKDDSTHNILVNNSSGFMKLDISTILFVESSLHYVIYYLEDDTIKVRDSMKRVEETLKKFHFAKCNNSYLVNLDKISKVQNDDIYIGKEIIKISRSKKKEFLDALATFYGEFK